MTVPPIDPNEQTLNPDPNQSPTEDPPTQPNDQPPPSAEIDLEELKTLRAIAEKQAAEIQNLRSTVHEVARNTAPKAPEPPPLPDKSEDPVGYLEARMEQLRQQMDQSILPLRMTALEQQRQASYIASAQQLNRKYPQLDQKFFEELYHQLPPNFDPNVANLELAASAFYGTRALAGAPPIPPTTPNTPPVTPPPTPAPTPRSGPSTPRTPPPELTEGQRRAMLRAGFKVGQEKEFLEYLGNDTRTVSMGY